MRPVVLLALALAIPACIPFDTGEACREDAQAAFYDCTLDCLDAQDACYDTCGTVRCLDACDLEAAACKDDCSNVEQAALAGC